MKNETIWIAVAYAVVFIFALFYRAVLVKWMRRDLKDGIDVCYDSPTSFALLVSVFGMMFGSAGFVFTLCRQPGSSLKWAVIAGIVAGAVQLIYCVGHNGWLKWKHMGLLDLAGECGCTTPDCTCDKPKRRDRPQKSRQYQH